MKRRQPSRARSAISAPRTARPRINRSSIPLVAIIGVTLAGYLSTYGTGMFASALLIGAYAGWKSHSNLNREVKATTSQ
jgi:hypothetical protein